MRAHFSLIFLIALLAMPTFFHIPNLIQEKGIITVSMYVLFSLFLLVLPLTFLRPKIFFYFALPFMLLIPAELIHVAHYDGYSTLAAFVSTLETNPHEAIEFQHNYRAYLYILYPLILFCIIAFIRYVGHDYRLTRVIRSIIFVSFITILSIFTTKTAYDLHARGDNNYASVLGDLYSRLFQQNFPYSYFLKGFGYLKQREAVAQSLELKKDFMFNAKADKQVLQQTKPVVILVVGETSRAYSWQLSGYHRTTNPKLSKRRNLLYFTDTISAATHTSQTIQLVLSRATPGNLEPIYKEKSIITAFKEAGYKTIWMSNQNMTGGVETTVYSIAAEADKRIFVGADYEVNPEFDGVLIPMVKKVLDNNKTEPLFIIIHTMGSHEVYRNRYPPDFEVFKPASRWDDYNFSSPGIKERIQNSYDNSILYTDHVLDGIIDVVEKSQRLATLAFFSDHGENILDDGTSRFGHGGVIPTLYVTDVPMFIWASNAYQSKYSEKFNSMKTNRLQPASNMYLFDTLLDIGGIHINGKGYKHSLADANFTPTNRYVLNSDYLPVSYSDIIIEARKEASDTTP